MVDSAHIEAQGRAWPRKQEEKWQALAMNKIEQLDSLFAEHLQWFHQHKTVTSLIATRRTLVNDNATDNERTKRKRIDNMTQNQPDPQQSVTDSKSHPTTAINTTTTTNLDDNVLDTSTRDLQPSTTREITNDVSPDDIQQESAQSPPKPPAKISREYLLRHFEQEEQKYGRYGLRNRSLGSKRNPNSDESPEQQRRKTIANYNTFSSKESATAVDDIPLPQMISEATTMASTAVSAAEPTMDSIPATAAAPVPAVPVPVPISLLSLDNTNIIPEPIPTSSLPSDIIDITPLPNNQLNIPSPKEQSDYPNGHEEQFHDEILLLSRASTNSNNTSFSATAPPETIPLVTLNDGSSRDELRGANDSFQAREGYSFSSLFSFNRASSSALETSVHHDDPNISNTSITSNSSKVYTPKRSGDSYHARTSRLAQPSSSTPSKNKISSQSSSSSPGTPTRTHRHTNSPSAISSLPRHQSYTPGKPWNATPVSASFLSSSTIYSDISPKRDSSRRNNSTQSSNVKKSLRENSETNQDIKVVEEHEEANEPEQEEDPTPDDSEQSTVVVIPSWACHPELDQLLRKQIKMDADKIFGKMPPLQVSQIVNMDGY